MRRLARATAIVFVVVGMLAVLGGAYEIVRAFVRPEPFMPALLGSTELEGLLLPLRLLVGGILSLQGLMLSALGEGLWLLTSLADHGQRSTTLLEALGKKDNLRST